MSFDNVPIEFVFNTPELANTIYLDRDGVINETILRKGKLSSPRNKKEFILFEDLKVFKSTFFQKNRFNIVIVSNQPDLSRGIISLKLMEYFHKLIRNSINIDVIYLCPHTRSYNCSCRKPKNGMINCFRRKFIQKKGIELMIGDQDVDRVCALDSSIPFILKNRQYNVSIANKCKFLINDLTELSNLISFNKFI